MKRKPVAWLVVIGVAIAASYALLSKPSQTQEGQMPPTEVSVVTITRQPVDVSEEFPARLTPFEVSEVRPQVSGIVQERLFTEGGLVRKGQQLYQIDPAPFRATYNSANASLVKARAVAKAAKAKAARYKDLIKIEAISKQDYDDTVANLAQAEADVGVAQAELAQAKINLDYTKVYAPIAGRISKSSVTAGALVSAGQATALATITQLHPIFVDISQSSDDMQRLRSALKETSEQSVTLVYKNAVEHPQKGTLQFTDITVDPTTNAVQMRALFPNPEGELLPGMFVRARLDLARDNALIVPQKATTRNADGTLSVWRVAKDNTVQPVAIATERALHDQWLVTGGVNEGDVIVLEGVQRLQPGMQVQVAKPADAAPEATANDAAAEKPAAPDAAPAGKGK